MDDGGAFDALRERLAGAPRVLAITGAGISAESGISTFRGAGGWWKNHDPARLASPQGFAADPALVWEWYIHRIRTVLAAEPNAGHRALAELERRASSGFCLLTQNVDGLHQRAGSRRVHEIHGTILQARGTRSDRRVPVADLDIDAPPPLRAADGELLRPDVVWFGETIRTDAYRAVETFLDQAPPDVCLVVGTSGMFPYIQAWAIRARMAGALLAEINPEPGDLASSCDIVIARPAGEALPKLLEPASTS